MQPYVADALDSLSSTQVMASPSSVQWIGLKSLGSMESFRPLKSFLDSLDVISKATVNAKVGSYDSGMFGMTLNTFLMHINKLQERFVSKTLRNQFKSFRFRF